MVTRINSRLSVLLIQCTGKGLQEILLTSHAQDHSSAFRQKAAQSRIVYLVSSLKVTGKEILPILSHGHRILQRAAQPLAAHAAQQCSPYKICHSHSPKSYYHPINQPLLLYYAKIIIKMHTRETERLKSNCYLIFMLDLVLHLLVNFHHCAIFSLLIPFYLLGYNLEVLVATVAASKTK